MSSRRWARCPCGGVCPDDYSLLFESGKMVVTADWAARSIGSVPAKTMAVRLPARRSSAMLTKRRAVDFCRVATALCPAAQGGDQFAARPRGIIG